MSNNNEQMQSNPTMETLLRIAHEKGFEMLNSELLQIPNETNRRAVVRITLIISGRLVYAHGKATEENVRKEVSSNLVGIAETRAFARAVRIGVNIAKSSMVELTPDEYGKLKATEPQKKYIKDLCKKREVMDDLKRNINDAWKEMTREQAEIFIPKLKQCNRKAG